MRNLQVGNKVKLSYKGFHSIRDVRESEVRDCLVLVSDALSNHDSSHNYDKHKLADPYIYVDEIDKYNVEVLSNE